MITEITPTHNCIGAKAAWRAARRKQHHQRTRPLIQPNAATNGTRMKATRRAAPRHQQPEPPQAHNVQHTSINPSKPATSVCACRPCMCGTYPGPERRPEVLSRRMLLSSSAAVSAAAVPHPRGRAIAVPSAAPQPAQAQGTALGRLAAVPELCGNWQVVCADSIVIDAAPSGHRLPYGVQKLNQGSWSCSM